MSIAEPFTGHAYYAYVGQERGVRKGDSGPYLRGTILNPLSGQDHNLVKVRLFTQEVVTVRYMETIEPDWVGVIPVRSEI